jgi:hypothetical protein
MALGSSNVGTTPMSKKGLQKYPAKVEKPSENTAKEGGKGNGKEEIGN